MDPDLYSIVSGDDATADAQAKAMAKALRRQNAYAVMGGTSPINAVRQQSPGLMKDAFQREDRLSEMPRQRLTQSMLQAQSSRINEEQADRNDPAMAGVYQGFASGNDDAMNAAAKGMRPGNFPQWAGLVEKRRASQDAGKMRLLMSQQVAAQKAAQTTSLSPKALDMAAREYATKGDFTKMGNRALSIYAPEIMNRAIELFPDLNVADQRGSYQAKATALNKMEQMANAVQAFERTASKNMEMIEGYLSKIPDGGGSFVNKPMRALAGGTGDVNVAGFMAAMLPVQSEAARILSTANLAGQLTDESRREMQKVLDPSATPNQIREALKVLRQDFSNRLASNKQQIGILRSEMGSAPGQQQAPPGATPGAPPPASNLAQKYGL